MQPCVIYLILGLAFLYRRDLTPIPRVVSRLPVLLYDLARPEPKIALTLLGPQFHNFVDRLLQCMFLSPFLIVRRVPELLQVTLSFLEVD